jgi:thymidylate synthase (FAD)
MKIIKQSYQILYPFTNCGCEEDVYESPNSGFVREAKLIELAGRTAYKSENKISDTSFDAFIRGIIKRGHESVIEFGTMMVKFITNRGVTHELVRHRLCSFLQESTRYLSYDQDKFGNEITVIEPSTWKEYSFEEQSTWIKAMQDCEERYFDLLNTVGRQREGALLPQQARGVLPNDLKTEICVRTNYREWRKIFKLRCDKPAHPDIRALMTPLRDECIKLLPCVFADLKEDENA